MSNLSKTEVVTHEEPPSGLQLVIMEATGSRRVDLPTKGTLQFGRDASADVQLDTAAISRNHASLHVGSTLQIEDHGSSNGTFLHGSRIEAGRRVDISPGEFFEIGGVVCVVRGKPTDNRLQQLRSHEYFTARLEDEVARTKRTPGHPAVIRIRLDEDDDKATAELLAAARPGDVVARYAPRNYEMLIVDGDASAALGVMRDVAVRLERCERLAALGSATFPKNGDSAEKLFLAACEALEPDEEGADSTSRLVVESPAMRKLHELLAKVAKGGINVLFLGETGVGKEVFAEQLHALSPRKDAPLVRINCAAFTGTLFESEVFGHEKGAFTGADSRKIGLLEAAQGGMVFLDEAGEMDLEAQAKLLRVIEDKKLRRVGGVEPIELDVVFVSATNRNLEARIASGEFRSDLYYRLNGFSLTIPPLRERKDEVLPLARGFIAAAARRMKLPAAPTLSDEAAALLEGYRWPGNIRELRNMMDRVVLLATGPTIEADLLPVESLRSGPSGSLERALARATEAGEVPEGLTEEELDERAKIIEALAESLGNQTRAADSLGISRRWLSTKMARYKIPRARKR